MINATEKWAWEEFGQAQLGDKRRTDRLVEIAHVLAEQPTASIPQASSDLAGLKATYRFFDNDEITAQAILQAHIKATQSRCAQQDLILAVQDTTLLDYTTHPATTGLGPLASVNNQGLLVHTTVAFTRQGLPLGLLDQQVWSRKAATFAALPDHKKRDLDNKESGRWLASLAQLNELKAGCGEAVLVSVGDREADIYDLFMAKRVGGVELLIRAAQDQDRRVKVKLKDGESGAGEMQKLWGRVESQPISGKIGLDLAGRTGQAGRRAEVSLRYCAVELAPPLYRAKEKLKNVTMWAVLGREEAPPEGIAGLEWLLVSTQVVENEEAAEQSLANYARRWGIETWHKVLKSGCRIEARQLESSERLERCLSVYSVIAWRIMYLTMLGRSVGEVSCEAVFEEEEWQALYCYCKQSGKLPSEPPSLNQVIKWVGELGGYLGRKGDGEPGVTVLWRGLARLKDLTSMYQLLRPVQAFKTRKVVGND